MYLEASPHFEIHKAAVVGSNRSSVRVMYKKNQKKKEKQRNI